MLLKRSLMIATVGLLALGFAFNAQAGPRLYEGTIIIHGFSNDTTSGSTARFTNNSVAPLPMGLHHCNIKPFHAMESSVNIATYYNTLSTNGNYTTFTVPSYGGQIGDFHTPGSKFIPASCDDEFGSPLTGKGTILTTGTYSTSRAASNPRGFAIESYDMAQVSYGGSLAYDFPYIFSKLYINLANDAGSFGEDMGPGRYGAVAQSVWNPVLGGPGSLGITPGSHKFGGTMKLLGTVYNLEGFWSDDWADTMIAKYTWLFQYVGDAATADGFAITAFNKKTGTNPYIGRQNHFQYKSYAFGYNLSWTTGTASVTAGGGPLTTVMARAGYDDRDAHGYGKIQMVSPMLTRWVFTTAYFTGGVGIMRLDVAPEPHEWMLLGAGLSMLGLLYRANRRSR